MDITDVIKKIESQVGRLSPVQKILLGTDGSVTQLLELVTGCDIAVHTQIQEIVPADETIAANLGIEAGDPVNHRIIELINKTTGEVLIHAISHTPVSRLSPSFREDLMKADIPIGRIIKQHRIEARREILSAGVFPATNEAGRLFSICPHEPVLNRQYHIIHDGKPLIFIEEQFPYNRFRDEHRVIIRTPSRIHITLIDMHGGSGRVDGGVGIALDEPGILLEVHQSPELEVNGCEGELKEKISDIARHVLREIHASGSASITLRDYYPSHTGLGSGSQLAIALGRAISECYHRNLSIENIAGIVGRGGTSGIGCAAFERGGFIVDGGHRYGKGFEKSDFRPSGASYGIRPPPVIVRHDFPSDWQILLATPALPCGASGGKELDIFRRYCPVPLDEVRIICHEVLMRMLPGIVERDLDLFGSSLNEIQKYGFKRVELSLQPKEIPELIEILRSSGAAGAGLSSFGPTVYAISDTGIRGIEQAARSYMKEKTGGSALITSARNQGAVIRTE
ncbi:MAG TPA: beta-ribofuranosylaminobenzene 5'-phosphate synthase [Methanoregulaceae archaeon]|nr:beta-ribofuranosylaminobenzene 5'-phosphate synthase [Methanoregulaceae archaeon]